MRILVLVAHLDDVSLTMWIRLQQHILVGDEVFVHWFSCPSRRGYMESVSDDTNAFYRSMSLLWIKKAFTSTCILSPFNERGYEDVWREMRRLFTTCCPDVLYTHFPKDLNRDHEIISQEALAAAWSVPSVIYFTSTGTHHFHPTMIALWTPQILQNKLEAMRCFSTQHYITEMLDELPVHSAGLLLEHLPHELLYKRQQEGKDYFAELFCVERMVQF